VFPWQVGKTDGAVAFASSVRNSRTTADFRRSGIISQLLVPALPSIQSSDRLLTIVSLLQMVLRGNQFAFHICVIPSHTVNRVDTECYSDSK
jgi:hypothetical protein